MIHNNQSLLYVSCSWKFRHRFVQYYWYNYVYARRHTHTHPTGFETAILWTCGVGVIVNLRSFVSNGKSWARGTPLKSQCLSVVWVPLIWSLECWDPPPDVALCCEMEVGQVDTCQTTQGVLWLEVFWNENSGCISLQTICTTSRKGKYIGATQFMKKNEK